MTDAEVVVPLDDNYDFVVNGALEPEELDLFHSRGFYDLHRANAVDGYYFVLRERRSGVAYAAAHFLAAEAAHFKSPLRGSFGGFGIVPGVDLSLEAMEQFAGAVDRYLADAGAREVTLILPPLAYHPSATSVWINVLLRGGYAISRHELNYAIDVGGAFVDRIDRGNRKQLTKCERAGLVAKSLRPEDYGIAYGVIAENRRKRGRTLSMSWPALAQMCDRFPEHIRCFGVWSPDGEMVAAAITMVVNPSVLYVFYWGEIAGVESLSPVTLLAKRIYEHCLAHDIALLDLGTSTTGGVPNHGLIRYKKHLGCRESLKLTLHKAFA